MTETTVTIKGVKTLRKRYKKLVKKMSAELKAIIRKQFDEAMRNA